MKMRTDANIKAIIIIFLAEHVYIKKIMVLVDF